VLAIYIRDVTTPARDREVHAIADEVRAMGVEMVLVEEKSEAAEHAARHGLISRDALRRMHREEESRPEPDLLEKLVNPEAR
jgi:phosphatidate phosphatase APP1